MWRIAVYLGLLILPALESVHAESADWTVGVATADITPDYPVRLNGFGFRRTESEGVRAKITAKALVIGRGEESPVVLIATETLGIPDAMVERLSKKLQKQVGIPRDRLAVTATHTHTAPMVNNVSPTLFGEAIPVAHQAHIDQYSLEFEQKLEQVALEAIRNRRPASLSWGIGRVGFAKNRRTAGGPVDHDLPILVVKEPDGKLRAVYLSYACHCVTLSDNRISGDWAGYASEMIERQNPGCTALVSVGCGADANPSSGVTGDRGDIAEMQGVEIAEEVRRLLAGPLTRLDDSISTKQDRMTLELAPLPTREAWVERSKLKNAQGFYAQTMLDKLDRGEALTTEISYLVQSWMFGDELAMVFLPGEVVVDYSRRLKRELDGSRLWINAYSNGCPGYIPSERILREGGYEGGGAMVYYSIPAPYATGLEDKIVAEVKRQVPQKFSPSADASQTQGSLPSSPQKTAASFHLNPGFVAEVVAAEPLIESPVAIDFDQQGRLWVAEMYDYPSGIDNQFTPGGRIKLLTDSDGDGKYDEAKLFLEGIPFPTGVTVWRDGVLICAAPDILFARDTDGDGKADDVQRLFSGFATQNYQARVNSLEYGFDGWVYGAAGLFGGEIACLKAHLTVPLGQRDFRIDPDRGVLEPAGGRTQQGRAKDDWGNWFGCTNSSLAMHFPVEERYLSRNPFVRPPATVRGIVAGPDGGKLFPISELVQFKLTGTPGTATAACGLGIYRDNLLGEAYRNNLFVCEPVNNLVHRRVLKPNGASFDAFRADDEPASEFLSSTDKWFRPVQAKTGPDGALWVVDMYRYVIEHPTWIPPETLAELDVRAGANRGRIYRVFQKKVPPRAIENLSTLSSEELATNLKSPNGPVRDLTQQMLLWNNPIEAIPTLNKLLASELSPASRIQTLHTLELLDSLKIETLTAALSDASLQVRQHALRIAETHLNEPSVCEAVLACEVDSLPLKIQLASILGEWADPRAATRLAQLAFRSDKSPYLRSAVFSSLNAENIGAIARTILESASPSESLVVEILEQTAALADSHAIRDVIVTLANEPDHPQTYSRVSRMFAALARRLRDSPTLLDSESHAALDHILSAAREEVTSAAPESVRVNAIKLLSLATRDPDEETKFLANLLVPAEPAVVQQATIAGLVKLGDEETPGLMLAPWTSYTPTLRKQVLNALLSRLAWTTALLESVKEKQISESDLDLVTRERLLQHDQIAIRNSAQVILNSTRANNTRQAVVAQYKGSIGTGGQATRGRELFRKHCTACHRLEDSGNAVGPDLAVYSTKPSDALLIALLDPNQSVDPRYQSYIVVLTDGRVLNGMLVEETSNGLTLLNAEGKKQAVLRVDIEEFRSTGRSLMPEGFERNLSPEDAAHLVAYFRSLLAVPKSLAGNSPTLLQGNAKKSLSLSAATAKIYGADITFESPFGNIGYWHNENDFVHWELELASAGEFDVWLDWACDASSAGNSYVVQLGNKEFQGTVLATGGWDQYRQTKLGTISLSAGRNDVLVRPTAFIKGALLDLRSLTLVPAGTKPAFEVHAPPEPELPKDPPSIARYLIDDKNPTETRQGLLAKHPEIADKLITVMTAGFAAGTPAEYQRIPWIWRVAIQTGKRNRNDELRNLLVASLPRPFEPLRDWQAVVIGGGLINGVGLSGDWPQVRFASILVDDPVLQERWDRTIDLSFAMANDEKVKNGTRYDALRMVALAPWQRARPVLENYLAKEVSAELQMGAVSGLVDVPEPAAATMLIDAISYLPPRNRNLAFDGLLKSDERTQMLLDALEARTIDLELIDDVRRKQLLEYENQTIRARATKLLY